MVSSLFFLVIHTAQAGRKRHLRRRRRDASATPEGAGGTQAPHPTAQAGRTAPHPKARRRRYIGETPPPPPAKKKTLVKGLFILVPALLLN